MTGSFLPFAGALLSDVMEVSFVFGGRVRTRKGNKQMYAIVHVTPPITRTAALLCSTARELERAGQARLLSRTGKKAGT
jgi:hypothetical protein